MIKKVITSVILVFLICACAYALEFDTRITSVQMHPDFWGGLFPTSVSYAAGLDGLEFLQGRKTDLFIELGSGTLARKITRDPLRGIPLEMAVQEYEAGEYPKGFTAESFLDNPDYDVMYAAATIELSQGIIRPNETEKDYLTLSLAVDGRWEIALDPILQTRNREGYPFYLFPFFDDWDGETEYPKEPLNVKGTPDLRGDRNLVYMDFRFSGVLDDLLLRVGSRRGLKTEFEILWAPSFLNFTKKGGGLASFWRIWAYVNGGTMIMQRKDDDGNNLVSVGFSYDAEGRFLEGTYVPKTAQSLKGSIWFVEPENMTYLLRGTAKLDLYGPQFLGSCIPRIYLFFDFSSAWGKYNNTRELENGRVNTASYGVHLEVKLFGAVALYYEMGHVFYYTGKDPDSNLGFKHSDGLKVAMELSL